MRFKQGSIMKSTSLQVDHEIRQRVWEKHFRRRGSTFIEQHRGGKECHVCAPGEEGHGRPVSKEQLRSSDVAKTGYQ